MKVSIYPTFAIVAGLVLTHPAFAGTKSDMIEKMDDDDDGKVSFAEFESAPPKHKMHKLKERKADHEQKMRKHFEELDANDDGHVTWNEMEQYHHEMRSQRMEKMQELRTNGKEMMQDRFKQMDTDNDGAITKEEIKRAAFARMDENGDGYLTADELKSSRKLHLDKRKRHHGKGH